MPKNLVLFSDGTGNSAGKLFKTNVWRLYQAVDLTDPQDPAQPRQFSFYDDGVGSSSFKPLTFLGGAFGFGLARNVMDLYVFLCRMYEPGDRIYAFGFSRGAFTVRVLLGLVMSQGLLRWHGDELELRRLAHDAYRAYRAQRCHSLNPAVGWLRALMRVWLERWNRWLKRTQYSQADRHGLPGAPDAVTVEFVGLWDTVDAYGLPVDELTRAIDLFIWPLTMRDYTLDPRVKRACHALALDDERNAFHPRLWNDISEAIDPKDPPPGADGRPLAPQVAHERISQVWFAGVHSNVGGGYPDDGLAHTSLLWIIAEAQRSQLRLMPLVIEAFNALSDENGPLVDSRRGVAGYYRYNPRRIEQLARAQGVSIGPVKVHESALRRIRAGHDGYAPIALPPGFAVVTIGGDIVDGDDYLRGTTPGGGAAAGAPPPPAATAAPPGTSWVGPASDYGRLREHVYNGVWWRRVAYFVTLGLSLLLALLPLARPGNGACSGWLCFLAAPIAALGRLLPAFATPWTDAFASHPDLFLPLAAAVAIGLWGGSWLDCRLHDRMRRLWYSVPALKPPAARRVDAPATPGPLDRAVEWLRTRPAYRTANRVLTHALLPSLFLASIAFGMVALMGQLVFSARASWGAACPDGIASAADGPLLPLDPRRICVATGVAAEAGATYRVRITVPASTRWLDGSLPAGTTGLQCPPRGQSAITMAVGIPLRRHLAEPWFRPMARIGSTGNDSYALVGEPRTAPRRDRCDPAGVARAAPAPVPPGCADQPPPPDAGDDVIDSTLVARTAGPIYLYVNDAIPLPGIGAPFYDNNRGCGWLQVSRVLPPATR